MQKTNQIILFFALLGFLNLGCEEDRSIVFHTQDALSEDASEKDANEDNLESSEAVETIEETAEEEIIEETIEVFEVEEIIDDEIEEEVVWEGECVEDLSVLELEEIYLIVYQEGVPKVVKLYTTWCYWCDQYAPNFNAGCREWFHEGVEFFDIDVEERPVEFRTGAVPTTCFLFDGEVYFCERGYMEEEELNMMVEYFLNGIGWIDTRGPELLEKPVKKCDDCYCTIEE